MNWQIANADADSKTLRNLLDDGWEPFAVIQSLPQLAPVVYVRKQDAKALWPSREFETGESWGR